MRSKLNILIYYIFISILTLALSIFEILIIWPGRKSIDQVILLISSLSGLYILNLLVITMLFQFFFRKMRRRFNLIPLIFAEVVVFLPPVVENYTNFFIGFISIFGSIFVVKLLLSRANIIPLIVVNHNKIANSNKFGKHLA